jgi:(5-formylfuran-3-yl)methyl phosphate synthase
VAKLLVSVRSRDEALAALAGGADVVDVKEPLYGPLGRATPAVWREVREVVPPPIPLSVALGELNDWLDGDDENVAASSLVGVSYRKLGFSHAPPDWFARWQALCTRWSKHVSSRPAWVAVVYIDWQAARAPDPDSIIRAASELDECEGVLFDTWGKTGGMRLDRTWKPRVDRVRDTGRFVTLAGSLDIDAIKRLTVLEPDIFAVRGAACIGGDRLKTVDSQQVSELARAVGNVTSASHHHSPTSNRTPCASGNSLP